MPIQSNLNISPYFNDYDEDDKYYRVLFKPGVPVQVRELNELQDMFASQIERFGSNIYKSGTIISGLGFLFIEDYGYVKLRDLDSDSNPVVAANLEGLFVRNEAGLVGIIEKGVNGFEVNTPNLNTLYVRYISSSNDYTTSAFAANTLLTVYDSEYPLESILVANGGLGFSNGDSVVVTPAIDVNISSSNAFSNGEVVSQACTNARGIIVEIANNAEGANNKILRILPLQEDMTNTVANASLWTFQSNLAITGNTSGAVANVENIYGTGARSLLTTDSLGTVVRITVTAKGTGYVYAPTATIKTSNLTANTYDLVLTPRNFRQKVTSAQAAANAVGNAYAFGVTEGTVYLNGQFLSVNAQTIIVTKYDNNPNNVVVGLTAVESFTNTATDETLLDNASGTLNFAAPGADRLKITPTLSVRNRSEVEGDTANVNNFMILAEFDDGKPTKQFKSTQFNAIEDEFSRRTDETLGNFVVDEFIMNSKDRTGNTSEQVTSTSNLAVVIDPGLAYVGGKRVETFFNSTVDVKKGTALESANNRITSLNYGNYLRVNEVGGIFNFSTGANVSLRGTAVQFQTQSANVSNTTLRHSLSVAATSSGTEYGTARMRSFTLESGTPGTPSAVYRLYLFDVNMAAGRTLREVRSVYYDSGSAANSAVADAVLRYDASSNSSVAELQETATDRLVFDTNYVAVKNVTNFSYLYRTNTQGTIQTNNTLVITTSDPLPYGTTGFPITVGDENDIIVVPTVNLETTAITTAITHVNSSATALATLTFNPAVEDLNVGDYIKVGNSTAYAASYVQVRGIISANVIQVSSNSSIIAALTRFVKAYPQFVPISFESTNRTIQQTGANELTLNLALYKPSAFANAQALAATGGAFVFHNSILTDVTPTSRNITGQRDLFVKLQLSNNAGGTTGPWTLGVTDALRLKNVYKHNDSTVNVNSTDVTSSFFIDNGQDTSFYGLSSLVKDPEGDVSLSSGDFLLVKFDRLTSTDGVYTVRSFTINDTLSIANNTGAINTVEIPELLSKDGTYYDLRDCIDFRPRVADTATPNTDIGNAPLNPDTTVTFSGSDKKFPVPDSTITYDIEYYLGHTDRLILDEKRNFVVLEGKGSYYQLPPPPEPPGVITIATYVVAPYPSITASPTIEYVKYFDRKVGNNKRLVDVRRNRFTIGPPSTNIVDYLQPLRYSAADMRRLERRVEVLEYYTSVSLLEAQVVNRSIPSSVSPSSSRFKNGFIIDDFDTTNVSDLAAFEYTAEIDFERSELIPKRDGLNIRSKLNLDDATTATCVPYKFGFNDLGNPLTSANLVANSLNTSLVAMLPYTELTVINQDKRNAYIPRPEPTFKFTGVLRSSPQRIGILSKFQLKKK